MGAALLNSCVLEGRDRGRDGMREEAALCGNILSDSGLFHKPPNSCHCHRLCVCVYVCFLRLHCLFESLYFY